MGADEVGTLKGLTERRAILDRFIGEHGGRIANTAGDSVLADFGSAVEAVQCAVEAQTALTETNASLLPDKRVDVRWQRAFPLLPLTGPQQSARLHLVQPAWLSSLSFGGRRDRA